MRSVFVVQVKNIRFVMANSKPEIKVAVGIILNHNNEVLIAQRRGHQAYAGYWEFPGGKIEKAESKEQTLIRELKEELNITATEYVFLDHIIYEYPDIIVNLDVYKVTSFLGQAVGFEGQEIRWVNISEIYQVDNLLPASCELLKLLL